MIIKISKKFFIILILFLSFFQNTYSEGTPNGENLPGGLHMGEYTILKDVKIDKEKVIFSDSIILDNFRIPKEQTNFKNFLREIIYLFSYYDDFLVYGENTAYFSEKYLGTDKIELKYGISIIDIDNKDNKKVKDIYYIAEITCDKNGKTIINSGKYKNFPIGGIKPIENFYKYFKNCYELENFFDGNKRYKLSIDSSLDIRFILFSIIFSIILFYIFLLFIFYKILKKILIKKI